MRFREWLLKEDPDHLFVGKEYIDRFDDSVTFLSMDGFTLHSSGFDVTHGFIIGKLLFHGDAIRAAAAGTMDPRVALARIGEELDYDGDLGRGSLDILVRLLNVLLKFGSSSGRARILAAVPGIVWGRMWPEIGVVSFWNRAPDLFRSKDHLLRFVGNMTGREKEFQYEVEGELLDYDEFRRGGQSANPLFDPSKVHTMPPGPAKAQMMGAMGFMRSKPVDIRDRMKREEP